MTVKEGEQPCFLCGGTEEIEVEQGVVPCPNCTGEIEVGDDRLMRLHEEQIARGRIK